MQSNILINRLNRTFELAKGVDAIILVNGEYPFIDSNFFYFTDFLGLFEDTYLIVLKDHVIVIADAIEYDNAINQKNDKIEVMQMGNKKSLYSTLKDILKGKVVGYDENYLNVKDYLYLSDNLSLNTSPVADALNNVRAIKDEIEIDRIRKAVSITKESLNEIESYFKIGITERELAGKFNELQIEKGADKNSFDSIVSFGKNAAYPHHSPDDTKLKNNEVLLMDVGAKFENYCSDITRSFIFKPDKSTEKYRKLDDMYNVVKSAQELGLSLIKEGEDGKVVHNSVKDYINNYKNGIYNGRFTHSLGHMIGIDVHDGYAYALSSRSLKLKNNMIMSDEPGVYIPEIGGIRIEDDVLIQNGKGKFI